MQIIKDHSITTDDYLHLSDDAELPASGEFTVTVARWQADKDRLRQFAGNLGIRLAGDTDLASIASDLPGFSLITLDFPGLADGRLFSLARLLREKYGYKGEIRARGEFLRDQIFFLMRMGVNSFECKAGQDAEFLLPALREFTVTYQAACDTPHPLYRRR